MKYNSQSRNALKNYFPLPNEIFSLNLCSGEIAVYAYLMYCEDRKTFQCHPSYKTIGRLLKMSRNTTTIVAAITSVTKKPSLLSHVVLGQNFGLTKPSMILFEQIAVVNQNELLDYIGKVDSEYILRRIKEATKKTFGLWDFTVRQKRRASLCTEHLKEAMKDKGVIISRTHPFESKKQKCRKCNSLGYEYLITNKKEG